MKKYNVGIIGCGAILKRHIKAVETNDNFTLVSICDIQEDITKSLSKKYKVSAYKDYKKMISLEDINFVVIATPNGLHTEQSLYCLENGCDVIIEKPISLNPNDVKKIKKVAENNKQNAYCVLQVRLNPAVNVLKKAIDNGLLGEIRGTSLIQRWQRPIEYFTGWRAIPNIGGGTLYECGVHYIDIMNYILGKPKVIMSSVYSAKHTDAEIEDTIYSLLDYNSFGGTLEITIASEPFNLECSLSILGSNGYIKLGGKAMNIIESYNFLSNGSRIEFESLLKKAKIPNKPNSYGSYAGSCPNHTELYQNILKFDILEAYDSLDTINQIYNSAGVRYYEC